MCQFINQTDMTLEVALLEEHDEGWQVLPAARGANTDKAALGEVGECCSSASRICVAHCGCMLARFRMMPAGCLLIC